MLTDSPRIFWRLNEAAGTTAADLSGNGHSGTLNGTYTWGQPSAVDGYSLGLAATARVVSASLDWAATSFTAEALIKTTMTGKGQISTRDNAATARIHQFYISGGKIGAIMWNGSGSLTTLTGSTSVNTGTWQHVAFTHDGTTARLYVNGTQESAVAWGMRNDRTVPLVVGPFISTGTEGFVGDVDEVAVYTSALAAARILAHAQAAGVA